MWLQYAFNHPAAIRSYRQALAHDPGCAMCWWRIALAAGPNINAPMNSAHAALAREATSSVEKALQRNRDHPGACHYLIHAVEAAYPERAVECADRLAALMPGAGHIAHMPGHIYLRVGRYADVVEANRHAVHADETCTSPTSVRSTSTRAPTTRTTTTS